MKKRLIFILLCGIFVLAGACSRKPETPQEILLAFNQALEDDNLEDALLYVADDVDFKFLSDNHFTSKTDVTDFLKLYMVMYSDAKLYNLETQANRVRGTMEMRGPGDKLLLGPLEVTIEEGKITQFDF